MIRKNTADEKKDWLVKASSKVLGPFVFEDVHQLLKTKAITFIDEVRRTDQRWLLIKEHRDFAAIVQNLRFEHESGELTMTSAQTKTDQITRTDSAEFRDEMTPTPFVGTYPSAHDHSEPIKDVSPTRESSSVQRPAHLTGKAFGLQNDLRLHGAIEANSNRWRWILISAVVIGIVSIVGYQYSQTQKKAQEFDRHARLAVRYKTLQLYDQALVEYKRAQAIKETDFSVQSQMAPLMIAFEGDTLKARRLLEKSVLSNEPKAQMVDDFVGIALAYMNEGNFHDAEENLEKALSFDRGHLAANLNLMWIKYSQKSYKEALSLIDNIQTPPQALLALAEAFIVNDMGGGAPNSEKVDAALQKMSLAQRSSQYLRSEILLMIVYLQQKRFGYEASVPVMKMLLDEPQQVQSYFVQDPLIYRKWLDVSQWEKVCREIQTRFSSALLPKVVSAYCLQNFGKEAEAKKLIDEAMKQNPNDPFVLMQQLTLNIRSNRNQEAIALMRKSELKDFHLPLWYQGKICLESDDLSCAQNSFRSILDKKPSDIFARSGLASVYFKLGQKNEALSAIRAGISDEPQFLPLLELRDVLENQ